LIVGRATALLGTAFGGRNGSGSGRVNPVTGVVSSAVDGSGLAISGGAAAATEFASIAIDRSSMALAGILVPSGSVVAVSTTTCPPAVVDGSMVREWICSSLTRAAAAVAGSSHNPWNSLFDIGIST
jgi:hypothetical protein